MKVIFTQRMKDTLYHVWKFKPSEKDMEYIGTIKDKNGMWVLDVIEQYDTDTNCKMIFNSFYEYLRRKEKEQKQ